LSEKRRGEFVAQAHRQSTTDPRSGGSVPTLPDLAVPAVILYGAHRQYSGHQAGLDGAAQADPQRIFEYCAGRDPSAGRALGGHDHRLIHRRMARMPVCDRLVRMAGPKQQIFGQMLSDQLEPNLRAMLGEAAVHRKSLHPSQIEGAV
jgi:hypothetical protein